ncbi:hypothetical protein [Uliginosibacterium sediminicola]|uniref:Phage portal protein n=1 Tax=Uliginosibacterium sediminicola TaxID=2024550 RepID=A0ABU9YVU7_9RHOO
MPSNLKSPAEQQKAGVFATLGMKAKRWYAQHVSPVNEITEAENYMYGAGATTVSAGLLGCGSKAARPRIQIYQKLQEMESDPIGSAAIKILVSAALGGHETSGQLVFIEQSAKAKTDKRLQKFAAEIEQDLGDLFNRVAFPVAYVGAAFGDSYARVFSDATGVSDLDIGEMYRPALVQPFERASRTVGYTVYIGPKNVARLDATQLARMKMPRTQWIPQQGVVEKSMRMAVETSEIDQLPIMPSMVGGSLLYPAEDAYDKLKATLLGLVSQRWKNSVVHRIVGLNLRNMNKDQQRVFTKSVVDMYKQVKDVITKAIANGEAVAETLTSVLPMWDEKQLITGLTPQDPTSQTISVEDVMLHAKMFSGAIGVDMSMIGFADQLSGGLGEGGFVRTSTQVAENARIIRVSLSEFFDSIIDIHCLKKYGFVFDKKERPWKINFFGSISALEAERQRTRADATNAAALTVQAMQQLKDLGADKAIMTSFLTNQMHMDEEEAKIYAKLVDMKPPEGAGGVGTGGFGGSGFGNEGGE